jgi:hypothetical protein
MADALRRPEVLQSTHIPLLIAFLTAVTIFWYPKSIADEFRFCFGSLCFDFSMVMDD